MTRDAFAEQVTKLMKQLYYVSYTLLPNPQDQEDAVQECLRKALQKHDSLREEAYFKTWLIRILINECHNLRRKKTREFPAEEILLVQPEGSNGEVFEMISNLDEKYRLPIVLHHHAGYSMKEVAEILHIPEGTVKTRIVRGRKLLHDALYEREALA